ncbi:MAG: SusD/RagB family nutrient-binding outer membrane lipoprotein [Bacteroidales bacterium]|nr:SusD/RagB family nutrient-binding outer membrane lipoprotein [Bacteroidales bacterium]
MKKILTILLLVFVASISVSCDSYLDVNKNVDAPDYIEAELYLPGVLSAWQGCYWDVRATAPLTQMFGTWDYWPYALHSYFVSSDAAAEMWRVTYWLQGKNLENMISQAVEKEAWTLAGIGYAVKAYSWDYLTKMHGDLPMKDAFVEGLLSHNYDYQQDIYEQIRVWAKEAISYLEKDDKCAYTVSLASSDLVYGGDKEKWKKFAHGVIVRNLASLTNKSDFASKYANELLEHAALSLQSNADNAAMRVDGGGGEAQFSSYNNSWGVWRAIGTDGYWASDWAVEVMTGTVPMYDETSGNRVRAELKPGEKVVDPNFPYKLAEKQIITDTSKAIGHFDPRIVAKVGCYDDCYYKNINDEDKVKSRIYYGSAFTDPYGPVGLCAKLWGTQNGYWYSSADADGQGRWLYRNDAPYILMTASEINYCVAETNWKLGNKQAALDAWKKAVKLDVDFTGLYLVPGSYKSTGEIDENGEDIAVLGGGLPGGDMITKELYSKLAEEYKAGPYVDGMTLTDFSLSHIMMQKYVSLFPYGATEVWVDMRKYHYDIKYSGEYPSADNGWTKTTINQKWDTDESKVYKGLFLPPAQVEFRRSPFDILNEGAPCYRIRPRYNSEYMWNKPSLDALKPISGLADNYHCSIPWFAYPGDYPASK